MTGRAPRPSPLPRPDAAARHHRPGGLLLAGIGLGVTLGVGLGVAATILAADRGDGPGWASAAIAAEAPPPPRPALTVTAALPRRAEWAETVAASGAVAAWQEASVGAQIGGYRLVDVAVDVGDRVTRGQVLARFDPALLRTEEAQLAASHEQAEADRRRALALDRRGNISDKELLDHDTRARIAAAQLDAKRLQLSHTAVVAPDDGVISARSATLGAVVPVGQELFRLIRQGRLEWRGELTAAQLARIVPGQGVALALPDGSAATATVRRVAPTLDERSRLGIAYADVPPGGTARAGMYADGRIAVGRSPALAVPAQSVLIRDGRTLVAVLSGSSDAATVSLRPVTTGRRQGDEVEVVDGLADLDLVAVHAAGFLDDGDVVRIAGPVPGNEIADRGAAGPKAARP